ncbi:uncharacterized protein TNCV_3351101 [Trichonephila clavipes]|nr:uncharacterized protein TNCV_3351101 [Trichonephila clavipes]
MANRCYHGLRNQFKSKYISSKTEIHYTRLYFHAEIVEVDRGRVAIYRPFGEFRRAFTCLVLKANDRRTSCPCHDEFRGPRSDYVKQVASENINTDIIHL